MKLTHNDSQWKLVFLLAGVIWTFIFLLDTEFLERGISFLVAIVCWTLTLVKKKKNNNDDKKEG